MPGTESYFVDTWFWLSLLSKKESSHADAVRIMKEIGKQRLVTSHMVFDELLGRLVKDDVLHLRKIAVELIESLHLEATVSIIQQTPEQFNQALDRYKKYHDKAWSLTDCASMIIAQNMNISTVLTNDHHFEQASLNIRNS